MFKLLTNYIREQKTSLIQVFGLGLVVIIMVSSFLSLTFGTNYISNQYWTDIAKEEFHQDVPFNLDTTFLNGAISDTWLDNINYVEKNDEINQEKMVRATFQIRSIERNPDQGWYVYRFYFENSVDSIHVGENFAFETNHVYVDFKLTVPFNYPSLEQHLSYVQEQAALIDAFLYNPDDASTENNRTNFFITNATALEYYNNNILNNPIYPWAKRTYQESDINNQAKLYQWLVFGMLYGDNISWIRNFYLRDLLITGKVITFLQTTTNDVVDIPILVNGNTSSFDPRDLQDDEILIYKEFANENNLKIGQDYVFAGYNFHIKGFATSAIAANNGFYFYGASDNKNQTVAWINQTTMNKVSANPYATIHGNYFFSYNPEIGSKHITDSIDNEWIYQYFHQKLINDKTLNTSKLYSAIKNGIQLRLLLNPLRYGYPSIYKIRSIEASIWTNIDALKDIFIEIGSTFLGLIFVVVSIIIFIVIFKMIDRNKRLIGILKAHGYPNWKLNFSLVISTIFPIIFFATLGAALAIVFGHFIVSTYSTAVILINYGWPFYYQSALMVILIPFVGLAIVSFILVALLLRINALTLINNSWSKNKYNFSINAIFAFFATKITKNFNYYNKLALTTSFRGIGKMLFVVLVSIFASTLLLFSFSSAGLINNLLGLQFASINYKFNTTYNFDTEVTSNFINDDKQLLYKKESVAEIKSQPSLYLPIKEAIEEMIANPDQPKLIDFRYGYVMGSELYTIRKDVIEPNLEQFPIEFQKFWNQNKYFIDYLTNNNGKNENDLMINFGLLPYDSELENDYTTLELNDAHTFDINTIDTNQYYYDNDADVLKGNWSKYWGAKRVVNGVDDSAARFLKPGFKNTNFFDFANLTLERMNNNHNWLNDNFLKTRDLIINKFNIKNPDTSAVKIIPMIGSTVPGIKNVSGGDGNSIGRTVLYRYQGLDAQTKYIIGVVYDGARNLLQDTVLMPKVWINQAIFGSYSNLAMQFANTKFTNFNSSELHQYLPIISQKNDYLIDLSKLNDSSYLSFKGIAPGLTFIYDVAALKDMFQSKQYSLQVLIILFSIFSVILSFMIIIIISNINIRDNLVLIDILRSLGYTSREISYVFLLTTIPILIIFSLFSIFIAPILTGFVAGAIANFLYLSVPIIFKWWYFAITLLVVLLIYFLSYIITWTLNVNNKKLMIFSK